MISDISEFMTAPVVREDLFVFVTAMFEQRGVRPWWEFDRPQLPRRTVSLDPASVLQVALQ
jgi:hypothetical protein